MSQPVSAIVDELQQALAQERSQVVAEQCAQLRERISSMLHDRVLGEEDPILAKRRRLHHRLEVLEAKAQAGRFEDAEEDIQAVVPLAKTLAGEIEALDHAPGDPAHRLPLPVRRFAAIASREAAGLLRGPRGLALLVLALATFGLSLEASIEASSPIGNLETLWAASRPVALLLAPIAGVLVGHDSLAGELRTHRIHLVAAQPVSRRRILLAKSLGGVAVLGITLLLPALLASTTLSAVGTATASFSLAIGFPVSLLLLACAFQAIALALDAVARTRTSALTGTLAAILLLGPMWEQAFQAGEIVDPLASTGLGARLIYLASPQAAFGVLLDAFASMQGEVGGIAMVSLAGLVGWWLLGVGWTMHWVDKNGFPPSSRER